MAAKSNRELRDGRALDYCQSSDEPGRERLVVLDSDLRVTIDSPNQRLFEPPMNNDYNREEPLP